MKQSHFGNTHRKQMGHPISYGVTKQSHFGRNLPQCHLFKQTPVRLQKIKALSGLILKEILSPAEYF